jgi:hypothetical protein
MKKLIASLLLFLWSLIIFAQSWEAEEKNLSRRIQSGQLTQQETAELIPQWRKFKEDFGTYPELPFNQNNILEYSFIFENNLDKKVLYNRVLEWAAISFGALDAVLHYENFESGKIILKGSFKITYVGDFSGGGFWGNKIEERTSSAKAGQTYVITIKDNKLKLQIIDIEIEIKLGGYYTGTYYKPSEDIKVSIDFLYPISNSDKIAWKGNLNRLSDINTKIINLSNSLNAYISNYSNDYDF